MVVSIYFSSSRTGVMITYRVISFRPQLRSSINLAMFTNFTAVVFLDLPANHVKNSLSASAVPRFWHGALRFRLELLTRGVANSFCARPRKNIRADLDRDWPFRILSHDHTWNSKAGGFFL